MPPEEKSPFVRFLSAVKGHLVTRYGSGSNLIGAARSPTTGEMEWDEAQIVALSEQEAARYAREYNRAVANGALKERSREDYVAWRDGAKTKAQATAAATAFAGGPTADPAARRSSPR